MCFGITLHALVKLHRRFIILLTEARSRFLAAEVRKLILQTKAFSIATISVTILREMYIDTR